MSASSGGVRVLSQALMEMEVEQHVGAARHKRTPERSGYRNGYRPRDCDTRIGTVELEVPGSGTVATSPRSWSQEAC
jgi:transposase-like protein